MTALLRELVRKARTARPGIQVSTTGLVRYSRAYREAFQDWRFWLRSGLVDFVTLMCYAKDFEEFKIQVRDAQKVLGNLKHTNIAVGAYTFINTPEIFKRQFDFCEETAARSCVTFHYGSLLENPALEKILIKRRNNHDL